MSEEEIVELIVRHAREVLPRLAQKQIQPGDSLKELGANSIDRSEITMMTLESLSLDMPLVDVAGANNIGELASILHARSLT